ncbi:hypothetical protein BJN34_0200 [Cupriavidus necator]|uniref:Uncharacterized protein n=1 Tax=Cupriavidus necator TaxID=106590 RepID=A0A2P1DV02_CUPNE|nr:hypothetical protein BJN34_0200 [Cupriavidus necator]
MAIWKTRPIDEVHEVVLVRWKVFETERGECHFVGTRPGRGTGRVSSAIVEFDARTCVGVTRSGRRYVLEGAPGTSLEGEVTWAGWCQVNRVASYRDVTDESLVGGAGETT